MTDRRRALLTDSERAILKGEKEVSENYYHTVVSRVRDKIHRLEDDMNALQAHGELIDEFQEIVCENP